MAHVLADHNRRAGDPATTPPDDAIHDAGDRQLIERVTPSRGCYAAAALEH
jgi:hypothetical protein